MPFVLALVIFLVLLAVMLVAFSIGWKFVEIQRKKKVSGMFEAAEGPVEQPTGDILQPGSGTEGLSLAQALARQPLLRKLQDRIYEAGMTTSAVSLLAMMVTLAVLGALAGSRVSAPLFHEFAMAGLAQRVPLLDVRFFVAAVLMQRETGGNLAEILSKLSFIIRERFRLKGTIKAASAHGRITASVLTFLPIGTTLALMLVSPGYVEGMAADPDGRLLIVFAILGQLT